MSIRGVNSLIMKLMLLLIMLFSVSITSWAFTAQEVFATKPLSITVKDSSPPMASVSGTSADNSAQNKFRWAVIEIENNTKKVDKYLDDITMDIEVAIVKKSANSVAPVIIFTGKIDYWTLELDGKKHYYSAFVPGRLFNRYADNNELPSRADVYVSVKFSQKGVLLAEGYSSVKGKHGEAEIKKWFNTVRRNIKYNVTEVKNSVLGRRDTSWGVIEIDKYEYEKK